jgi:protein-tyrosine kinase
MSRIDEALKRVSQGPVSPRATRASDAPLRLADELTIEQYPHESGATVGTATAPPVARRRSVGERPVTVPARESIAPRFKIDPDSNSKVIIGAERNHVSLEQYRRLAATLHEAQMERGLRTVMVTSAVPREGKTLTAINLALTLSGSYGRRVLLIDSDLRRPSIHDVLGVPNDKGLSDVFHSSAKELPIVQVSTLLSVLPAGRADQNPQAGLSSERLRVLLEEATERFDWVVVDTPPVGLVSDAQILARIIQAVVFVIRAGSTPFPLIEKAVSEVGRESIIGTVLNGVEADALPATTYYGGYYGRE